MDSDDDRVRMMAAARRRQAGADLRRASGELGAAGGRRPDYGLPSTVLYRTPNLPAFADAIRHMRSGVMGKLVPTSLDAPGKLADALREGSHVAMLVDQYYVRGVEVTFFGRRTRANPLIARLARHFDCPIHGVYAVRHPGGRLRLHITDAICARARRRRRRSTSNAPCRPSPPRSKAGSAPIPSNGSGCIAAGGTNSPAARLPRWPRLWPKITAPFSPASTAG